MYIVKRKLSPPIRMTDYGQAKRLANEINGKVYLPYLEVEHLVYSYMFQYPEFGDEEAIFDKVRLALMDQMCVAPAGVLI